MKNELDSERSDSEIQEQGTRGQDSGARGQGNEEGRMKNEVDSERSDSEIQEQGTRDKDSVGRDQDGSSDEDNSSFPILPSSLSPPDYREILFRAAERSEDSEDGEITFTEEEARMLLADPLFCSEEPELAEDIRNALST